MKKIHSRTKRKFGLNTHHKHYFYFHPSTRSRRPKTFKTAESAHKYAHSIGLNEEEYSLVPAKKIKNFR